MLKHKYSAKPAILPICILRTEYSVYIPQYQLDSITATFHFNHSQVPTVASEILSVLFISYPKPCPFLQFPPYSHCTHTWSTRPAVNPHGDVSTSSEPDRATARTTCFCREPDDKLTTTALSSCIRGRCCSLLLLCLSYCLSSILCLVHGCIGTIFLRVRSRTGSFREVPVCLEGGLGLVNDKREKTERLSIWSAVR